MFAGAVALAATVSDEGADCRALRLILKFQLLFWHPFYEKAHRANQFLLAVARRATTDVAPSLSTL